MIIFIGMEDHVDPFFGDDLPVIVATVVKDEEADLGSPRANAWQHCYNARLRQGWIPTGIGERYLFDWVGPDGRLFL